METLESNRGREIKRDRDRRAKVVCGTSIAISAARSSVKMSDINRYLAFEDLVFSCFQGSRFTRTNRALLSFRITNKISAISHTVPLSSLKLKANLCSSLLRAFFFLIFPLFSLVSN